MNRDGAMGLALVKILPGFCLARYTRASDAGFPVWVMGITAIVLNDDSCG